MKVSDLILIEYIPQGSDTTMPKYFRKEDIAYAIKFQKEIVSQGGVIVTGVTEPKAVLTKEQDKALQKVLMLQGKEQVIITHSFYIAGQNTGWKEGNKSLNQLSLDVLCKALYRGYTVEKTPEEELAELYNSNDMDEVRRKAIATTLQILKITVPGVNA